MKPHFEQHGVTIYHANCLEYLEQRPQQQFDFIFTDPPYWTLDKWRAVGTTTRLGGHQDEDKRSGWFNTINKDQLWGLMCGLHSVVKFNRHVCVMTDGQALREVLYCYEDAGFSYAKPIVWDKVTAGMGYHLRCRHEFVVLMDKGKNRKPKDLSLTDIVEIKMIRGGYPTEKPVALPLFFIEQFAEPGEVVFDPFMGTGSTLLAAKHHGCKAVGIDSSLEACDIAAERLRGLF